MDILLSPEGGLVGTLGAQPGIKLHGHRWRNLDSDAEVYQAFRGCGDVQHHDVEGGRAVAGRLLLKAWAMDRFSKLLVVIINANESDGEQAERLKLCEMLLQVSGVEDFAKTLIEDQVGPKLDALRQLVYVQGGDVFKQVVTGNSQPYEEDGNPVGTSKPVTRGGYGHENDDQIRSYHVRVRTLSHIANMQAYRILRAQPGVVIKAYFANNSSQGPRRSHHLYRAFKNAGLIGQFGFAAIIDAPEDAIRQIQARFLAKPQLGRFQILGTSLQSEAERASPVKTRTLGHWGEDYWDTPEHARIGPPGLPAPSRNRR